MRETDFNQIDTLFKGFRESVKDFSSFDYLESFIQRIGETFEAERVYVFEKNSNDCYDCTHEWVGGNHIPKKELLQNIPSEGVKYYYNYFYREQVLSVPNIEDFKKIDYPMYKILKPQELNSFISTMLNTGGVDYGFIGVDNPSPDKFEELYNVIGDISQIICAEVQKKKLGKCIKTELEKGSDSQKNLFSKYSVNKRILDIEVGTPLSVVFCNVLFVRHEEGEAAKKILFKVKDILERAFGEQNVFHVGHNEFFVIVEDDYHNDVAMTKHVVSKVQRDVYNSGITAFIAASYVDEYTYMADFFELTYSARTRALKLKENFINSQVSKYHLPMRESTFLDLLELHPSQKMCRVLYSHSRLIPYKEIELDKFLEDMRSIVHEDDVSKFDGFWRIQLSKAEADTKDFTPWSDEETFRISNNQKVSQMKFVVTSYTEADGHKVLLCKTK